MMGLSWRQIALALAVLALCLPPIALEYLRRRKEHRR